VAGKGILGA